MFLLPLCYTQQVTQHIGMLLLMTWCKVLRIGEGGFSTSGSCWKISSQWEVFTDDEVTLIDASHKQLGTADLSRTAAGLK